MAIVRQFRPILDGSCCANTIITALLTASKIHRIPFQEAGAFNPALSIADFTVPGFWLFLPSFAHGDCLSGIVSAGLNTPAYWDGIKWIFDAVNSAVTIVLAQRKPSQSAEISPNFPHCEMGTLKSAIDSAGLNWPAYQDGIKWIFDYFNSAITIVVCKGETIEIGRNCLTIPMVKPEAPGGKLDVSRLWTPNRRSKIKSPRHLKGIGV